MKAERTTIESSERFVNLHPVGSGGFGEVFQADDILLKRKVAIKRYWKPINQLTRLRKTLLSCAQLRHPNLAQVLDVRECDGRLELVMTLCNGKTFNDRTLLSQLDAPTAAGHFLQIAEAVRYLHKQSLVHGDLKLSNVMLDGDQAVVIDLDQCRSANETNSLDAEDASAVIGTTAYMAPEQVSDGCGPSVASDIYALGIVLYELLRGMHGQEVQNSQPQVGYINQVKRRISSRTLNNNDWNAIIGKSTRTDPSERYQNVSKMIDDVQAVLEGKPISVRRMGRLERSARWCRMHPLSACLLALLFLLVGGASALILAARESASRNAILAKNRTLQLENSIHQVSNAQNRLAKLITEVEAELSIAQEEERRQREATLQATFIEAKLTNEAKRSQTLRKNAELALAQAVSTELELVEKDRKRRERETQLDLLVRKQAMLNYINVYREAWAEVQRGRWLEAESLSQNLDPQLAGMELFMLKAAIKNRRKKPERVIVINSDSNRHRFPPLHQGKMFVGSRTTGRLVQISHDKSLKLNIECQSMYGSAGEDWQLIKDLEIVNEQERGASNVFPTHILNDGSIVVMYSPRSHVIGKVIAIYTFNAEAYEKILNLPSEERLAKLIDQKLDPVDVMKQKELQDRQALFADGQLINVNIANRAYVPHKLDSELDLPKMALDGAASIKTLGAISSSTSDLFDASQKSFVTVGAKHTLVCIFSFQEPQAVKTFLFHLKHTKESNACTCLIEFADSLADIDKRDSTYRSTMKEYIELSGNDFLECSFDQPHTARVFKMTIWSEVLHLNEIRIFASSISGKIVGSMEAEEVEVRSTLGSVEKKEWRAQNAAILSNGHFLEWTSPKVGESLSIPIDIPADANTLEIGFVRSELYAVVELALDQRKLGNAIELYSSQAPSVHLVELDSTGDTAGLHELTITVVEKNPVMTDVFKVGIDYLRLYKRTTVVQEAGDAQIENGFQEPNVPIDPEIERNVAELVLKYGGRITVIGDFGTISVQELSQIPEAPFHIDAISLSSRPVEDQTIIDLTSLSRLRRLDLSFARRVTAVGLRRLSALTSLRSISIRGLWLKDWGFLEDWKALVNLRFLDISGSSLPKDNVLDLVGLQGLEELQASKTGISDDSLEHLTRLKHLHTLNLGRTRVTDIGIQRLREALGLRALLVQKTEVTTAGASRLMLSKHGLTVNCE